MTHISLQHILEATGGTLLARGTREVCAGICTDSRQITENCLYLALSGERFDGNQYAPAASRAGAAVVIISRLEGEIHPDCSVIQIEDGVQALQALATWWRKQLEPLLVIGLTGSNGKTSTKDMLHSILSCAMKSQATLGNLNNHIGLPLSILQAEKGLQAAVWEMGMNHVGELNPLCAMSRPEIGIITNIGSAHIEHMGERAQIAAEKCSLARSLPSHGCLIYPAHDDYADYIASQSKALVIRVGGSDSPVRASNISSHAKGSSYTLSIEGLGSCKIELPVLGSHMICNSLLAAAAAWKANCSLEQIAQGLSKANLTHGRLALYEIEGSFYIDDSYNANLESMIAALRTLHELAQGKNCIAVLGEMGELGIHGIEHHAQVGAKARELGYRHILTVGKDSEELQALRQAAQCKENMSNSTGKLNSCQVTHCNKHEEAACILRRLIKRGDYILFKGSRASSMERSLRALLPEHFKS